MVINCTVPFGMVLTTKEYEELPRTPPNCAYVAQFPALLGKEQLLGKQQREKATEKLHNAIKLNKY